MSPRPVDRTNSGGRSGTISGKFNLNYKGRNIQYDITKKLALEGGLNILHLRGENIGELMMAEDRTIALFLNEIELFTDKQILPFLKNVNPKDPVSLPKPEKLIRGQLDDLLLSKELFSDEKRRYLTREEIIGKVCDYCEMAGKELLATRSFDRGNELIDQIAADLHLINKGILPYFTTSMLISKVIKIEDSKMKTGALKILSKYILGEELPANFDFVTILRSIGLKVIEKETKLQIASDKLDNIINKEFPLKPRGKSYFFTGAGGGPSHFRDLPSK